MQKLEDRLRARSLEKLARAEKWLGNMRASIGFLRESSMLHGAQFGMSSQRAIGPLMRLARSLELTGDRTGACVVWEDVREREEVAEQLDFIFDAVGL